MRRPTVSRLRTTCTHPRGRHWRRCRPSAAEPCILPGKKSADLPPNAGPDGYRQIVQNQCVVNWTQHQNPSPCEKVFLAEANADSSGYALLADPDGGAHYLLIPTQTMTGTDSTELLDPNLPNYFAQAWHGRDLLAKFVGHAVPSADVGLAVGTAATRTQHQFHIHIECLRPEVVASLKAVADSVTDRWSPVTVAGLPFQAMRLSSQALDATNPFELVANLSSGRAASRGKLHGGRRGRPILERPGLHGVDGDRSERRSADGFGLHRGRRRQLSVRLGRIAAGYARRRGFFGAQLRPAGLPSRSQRARNPGKGPAHFNDCRHRRTAARRCAESPDP